MLGSFDRSVRSLISVLPRLHSVHFNLSAVEAKEDSIGPDAKPVVATLGFEFLNIPGEIVLEKLEPVADVAAKLVRKSAQLFARLFGDQEFIAHMQECTKRRTSGGSSGHLPEW